MGLIWLTKQELKTIYNWAFDESEKLMNRYNAGEPVECKFVFSIRFKTYRALRSRKRKLEDFWWEITDGLCEGLLWFFSDECEDGRKRTPPATILLGIATVTVSAIALLRTL